MQAVFTAIAILSLVILVIILVRLIWVIKTAPPLPKRSPDRPMHDHPSAREDD